MIPCKLGLDTPDLMISYLLKNTLPNVYGDDCMSSSHRQYLLDKIYSEILDIVPDSLMFTKEDIDCIYRRSGYRKDIMPIVI